VKFDVTYFMMICEPLFGLYIK